MAPATPNTALADQLVASLLPNGTSASRLRKHNDAFSRRLKSHNYARTNQFEVARKFEGLQEKLQILNNIARRCPSQKSDLLLRLSDEPTDKTRIEWLADISSGSAVVPSLTWAEIEAVDPVDRSDDIWTIACYSDLSSDDDAVEVVPTSDGKVPQSEEQEVCLQANFEPLDPDSGSKALARLREDQFWRNVSTDSYQLTELQVIREILFMLQGLPTALFWRVGNRYEIDQRFHLNNCSRETFLDILSDFGDTANRLDLLRSYANKPQSQHVMQTFRSALEDTLQHVDGRLSALEHKILVDENDAAATMIQLFAAVGKIVEVCSPLAQLIADIGPESIDVVHYLEIVFDRVCRSQTSGDEVGFGSLSTVFLQCFDSYFRPLREWTDQGTVGDRQTVMFVTTSGLSQDPSQLWQTWYQLADDSAPNRCPNFLQSVKAQIFRVGKSVVFLQRLNSPHDRFGDSPVLTPPESVPTSANSLVPFAEILATSVQDYVESRLHVVTRTLRGHLGNNCGLWKTLDALHSVYFASNGYVTDLVDTKIFTAIDRCDKNWNDRFLLRDLFQTIFKYVQCVEIERLSIRSTFKSSGQMSHRRQSMKLLKDIQVQYKLHWSVANVLTLPSLASYQRVSTFLTQIRRAKYILERRSFFQVRAGRPNTTLQAQNLNLMLHHNLLLFVNTLYSHFTTLVVEVANSKLQQDLADAADIDAMIDTHDRYCTDLEEACLTYKKLKPIHDEIVSVLDLCIRFSDLNNPASGGRRRTSSDARSYASAMSHQQRRQLRDGVENNSSDEIDSDDDDNDDDDGEGYSTFIIPEDSTLVHQLRKVRGDFENHLSFVVAGLKSMGRVSAQEEGRYWNILAARLDWRKSSR
ncbi:hypothetical protein EPUS_07621 [Endocarpon pusillum Z07020]|uniref:Spindle pole body component n=1 Tax=Endocarpon pusillum (strain Z07020 / HMAS-L-300199) TaxID=1263415 RepID=U1GF40_ENDPU|nr:uncharacterized protein EPUS_07621 [Endocarpon pusillum Z07020]ERF70356.1 hypothetical protein EPUS_07621 [Endocarpon pusillum Z07020]